MSVNDDLPWIPAVLSLIRGAVARDVPVLGHCLGGQLMARALGGRVGRSPAPEIGWQPIALNADPAAASALDAWFGSDALPAVFQWHYEAFTLPPGATQLASSPACPVQAFALGPHLAMQFHVEVDAAKLRLWSGALDEAFLEAQAAFPGSVQSGAAMCERAAGRLTAQQALADRIYRRWLSNAAR
jgi:GMP synthase-like glutamine amidotransferase